MCGLRREEPAMGDGVVWNVYMLGLFGASSRARSAYLVCAVGGHGLVEGLGGEKNASGWELEIHCVCKGK